MRQPRTPQTLPMSSDPTGSSSAPGSTTPGFTFDYTKYNAPGLTTQQLDDMYSKVMNTNGTTGYAMMIWTGLKLAFCAMYLWARTKSVDIQYQMALQAYMVQRAAGNQQEVDGEDPSPIKA